MKVSFRVIILSIILFGLALGDYIHQTKEPETIPKTNSTTDEAQAIRDKPFPLAGMDGEIGNDSGMETGDEVMRNITYVNASSSMIDVTLPYPEAIVGKTFSVIGKARGTWFFEASFPATILDDTGNVLAKGIAQAQGDWMTDGFVPFVATMTIPESYIGQATLVLKKDNPSGIPAHDASISFPITIKY